MSSLAKYTMTIYDIVVTEGIDIFDFDYDVPSYCDTTEKIQEFKDNIEQKFIDVFYFREIAHETIEMFKQRLKTVWTLNIPRFNKLWEAWNVDLNVFKEFESSGQGNVKLRDVPINEEDEPEIYSGIQKSDEQRSGRSSPEVILLDEYTKKLKDIDIQFISLFSELFMGLLD